MEKPKRRNRNEKYNRSKERLLEPPKTEAKEIILPKIKKKKKKKVTSKNINQHINKKHKKKKVVLPPNYIAYFDGACTPINPTGHMGIGAIIFTQNEDKTLFEYSEHIEEHHSNSSNVAEYLALRVILEYLINNGLNKDRILIYGDSKLVCMQMRGLWRIHEGRYVWAARECKELFKQFNKNKVRFQWIPREVNWRADELSKEKLIEKDIVIRY